MPRYIFDLETDGLLDTITKIHSLVLIDADTGEMFSFSKLYEGKEFELIEGLDMLNKADELIGHNIIRFDLPALEKVYHLVPNCKITDTITLARLIHSDIGTWDAELLKQQKLPGNLYKSHSLEAWGHRIGLHKMDYDGGWETWTPKMQEYCEHDTRVTHALWKFLKPGDYSQKAIELEHRVAKLCYKIEASGWPFDTAKAFKLYAELSQKREDLKNQLQDLFPPWEQVDRIFTPKRDNKKLGYVKDVPVTKMKTVTFNPASRQHIQHCLQAKYNWKPKAFTPSGQAELDEEILNELVYPEAKKLAEFFMIEKRIGQLAEGNQAWLKCEKNGRIHGSYNTNGTVTGRPTHSHPNISQVPSVKNKKGIVPYGRECRELFTVPRGYKEVGSDLSGLELRCLAHFMAYWDNGEYARKLIEGDVHTDTKNDIGLPSREKGKEFIYALIFGAGDPKIGGLVGKGAAEGKHLKEQFYKSKPAAKKIKDHVTASAGRGYIKTIDGRHIPIRSSHAALNSLLQSSGAVLFKEWIVAIDDELQRLGYVWDQDYWFLGWIHDELQIAAKEGLEETIGNICIEMATKVGCLYEFKCPIAAEYKVGTNWAECH